MNFTDIANRFSKEGPGRNNQAEKSFKKDSGDFFQETTDESTEPETARPDSTTVPSCEDRLKDRRKYQRCLACGDSFAMLRPHSKVMGQIIDVSRGGLSFRYIPNRRSDRIHETVCELHILLADHSFYFDTFPCRIVSDAPISNHEFGFSLLPMRRRSVEFLKLSREQRTQLNYFVRNHTTVPETRSFGGFDAH